MALAKKNNQAIGHDQKMYITLQQLQELLEEEL